MVVGPTGGGKTVIIEALAASRKEYEGATTLTFTINPKMITLNELYGVLQKILEECRSNTNKNTCPP